MTHRIKAHAAATVFNWFKSRGGIFVWKSADLCDPCKVWTTPFKDEKGVVTGKPSWQCDATPTLLSDPAEVEVVVPKEVKRFRVAVRMGASGTRIKLTDASSAKLRKALDKYGDESFYEFDYSTQEAVIFVSEKIISLTEFIGEQKASA